MRWREVKGKGLVPEPVVLIRYDWKDAYSACYDYMMDCADPEEAINKEMVTRLMNAMRKEKWDVADASMDHITLWVSQWLDDHYPLIDADDLEDEPK